MEVGRYQESLFFVVVEDHARFFESSVRILTFTKEIQRVVFQTCPHASDEADILHTNCRDLYECPVGIFTAFFSVFMALKTVLRNCNYFLQFRVQLLISYGSGSDF
jgi:hypothetical protein